MLKYKGFSGSAEVSIEDGCLHGKILFINDLIAYQATTVEDLKNEFEAAVEDYLEFCREVGKPVEKPFSGTFNIRIGPERHKKLAMFAARKDQTINEVIKTSIDELIKEKETFHQHIHYHMEHIAPEYSHKTSQDFFIKTEDPYEINKTTSRSGCN